MTTLIIAEHLRRLAQRPADAWRAVTTALTDWWHDLRTRSARLDRRLMEWPPILAAAMSDRGLCTVCGHEHALKQDGRVRAHHDCPGGDQLPAPLLIRSD